jgi:hypothetical protein
MSSALSQSGNPTVSDSKTMHKRGLFVITQTYSIHFSLTRGKLIRPYQITPRGLIRVIEVILRSIGFLSLSRPGGIHSPFHIILIVYDIPYRGIKAAIFFRDLVPRSIHKDSLTSVEFRIERNCLVKIELRVVLSSFE